MKYPTPPEVVSYALSVDVSGLRPWEWEACDAHEYTLIRAVRQAWEDGRAASRETAEGEKQKG